MRDSAGFSPDFARGASSDVRPRTTTIAAFVIPGAIVGWVRQRTLGLVVVAAAVAAAVVALLGRRVQPPEVSGTWHPATQRRRP